MRSRLLYIMIITLICGCSVDQTEMQEYVMDPENGLMHATYSEGVSYKILYQPVQMIVARESRSTEVDKSEIERELGTQDYFLLEIKRQDPMEGPKQEFYYAYQFEKDIFQLVGSDTIRPINFHLEQGLGGSQQFRANIAFSQLENDREIFIHDKYGAKTNFIFQQANINKIPKLSY